MSDKTYVTGLNPPEIKCETLLNYAGDFELNGSTVFGPVEHKTNVRFRIRDDFESYLNAIDVDYDTEDVTFIGYVHKLITPPFSELKRSAYVEGVKYMNEIVEYKRQNC